MARQRKPRGGHRKKRRDTQNQPRPIKEKQPLLVEENQPPPIEFVSGIVVGLVTLIWRAENTLLPIVFLVTVCISAWKVYRDRASNFWVVATSCSLFAFVAIASAFLFNLFRSDAEFDPQLAARGMAIIVLSSATIGFVSALCMRLVFERSIHAANVSLVPFSNQFRGAEKGLAGWLGIINSLGGLFAAVASLLTLILV